MYYRHIDTRTPQQPPVLYWYNPNILCYYLLISPTTLLSLLYSQSCLMAFISSYTGIVRDGHIIYAVMVMMMMSRFCIMLVSSSFCYLYAVSLLPPRYNIIYSVFILILSVLISSIRRYHIFLLLPVLLRNHIRHSCLLNRPNPSEGTNWIMRKHERLHGKRTSTEGEWGHGRCSS
jgi:hypothetical protein